MNCQLTNISLFLAVAGSLAHHRPESILRPIVYKILIDRVVLLIQTGTKHTLHDLIRLGFFDTADCYHNSHVQLRRFLRSFTLSCYLCPAILGIKEFPIVLDLFSHREIRHQAHLIHPHGNQIRTEFFTIQLHVNQPVIIRLIKGKWVIDKIVTGQVIVR